jgi:hypothetical protein
MWNTIASGLLVCLLSTLCLAAPPAANDEPAAPSSSGPVDGSPAASAAVPLNPAQTVFLDLPNKRLLLKTRVVLREGILEMFVCKAQTKEHESVLAIDADAYLIHAGLLALGAQPGTPARFDETFHPPTGQKIDIYVSWTGEDGVERRERAQSWMRHVTRRYYEYPLEKLPDGVSVDRNETELRHDARNKVLLWFGPMTEAQRDELLARSDDQAYQEGIQSFFKASQPREFEADFVFAGSSFYKQKDGKLWYQAESGNVICVANFSDAMIDVSVESSASNSQLLYEPYTERIPPLDTPVTVELIPVFEEGSDAP